jgi:hypothetical protein
MAAPTISLAILGAVLLVCLHGGCRDGQRSAAISRAGQEHTVQQQQAYDQWRTAAHQVTCALYGLHAESLVQNRDVGQVTLLEALAAIDQMERCVPPYANWRYWCMTTRCGRATTRMPMPSRSVYARRRSKQPRQGVYSSWRKHRMARMRGLPRDDLLRQHAGAVMAMLDLVGQIPPELLPRDVGAYSALIMALNTLRGAPPNGQHAIILAMRNLGW